jgi:hypothetical protein
MKKLGSPHLQIEHAHDSPACAKKKTAPRRRILFMISSFNVYSGTNFRALASIGWHGRESGHPSPAPSLDSRFPDCGKTNWTQISQMNADFFDEFAIHQ